MGEEAEYIEKPVIREAQRLAFLVALIDEDTAVVPAGAYALSGHEATPGLGFRGLTWDQASDFKNYQHFRPAKDLAALKIAAKDDVEFHSNFLDTLDADLPSGSWVTRS